MRVIAVLLMLALAACQPPLPSTVANSTAPAVVSLGAQGGGTIAFRLEIRTYRVATTQAHIAKYVLELLQASNNAVLKSVTTTNPNVNFTNTPNGTFRLRVDCLDADGQSLVVGGAQTSSNTVTVMGNQVTYSSGNGFVVDLTLVDSAGGTAGLSVSAPYNAGIGATLVDVLTGEVKLTGTMASLTEVNNLADGSYYLWTYLHDGAGIATPARRSGPVTVSGKGLVSGSFGHNSQARISTLVTPGLGDGGPISAANIQDPSNLSRDVLGNLYFINNTYSVRMIARVSGTYFGQAMTAGNIYTVAGYTTCNCFAGDGGPATAAGFNNITAIAVDSEGSLYIADYGNRRIRMVPRSGGVYFGQTMAAGSVYTIGGDGSPGSGGDGGPLAAATFTGVNGLVVDQANNLYISDDNQIRVRMVPRADGTHFGQAMTAGSIYRIAGGLGSGDTGDGGAATNAEFLVPRVGAVDSAGNVYIADLAAGRVRVVANVNGSILGVAVSANNIYTVAGNGAPAYAGDGGVATAASFASPRTMAVDQQGNLFIADQTADRVRMVPASSGTYFGQAMTANNVYTVAGSGSCNCFAGDGGSATGAKLYWPYGIIVDPDGNLVVSDEYNWRLRVVAAAGGTFYNQAMSASNIYTVGGTGTINTTGNGAPLSSATGAQSEAIAADPGGNLFWATQYRVFMSPEVAGTYFGISMRPGYAYVVAGTGVAGFSGDGGSAPLAKLDQVQTVATDRDGNLYIGEANGHRVRLVPRSGGTYFGQAMMAGSIYTVAGDGANAYGGDGGPATAGSMMWPSALAIDADRNLFIADYSDSRIRVVAGKTGTVFGQAVIEGSIYTVTGNGAGNFSGDGNPAIAAQISGPWGLTVDGKGDLFISDGDNNRIRMIPRTDGTYYGIAMTADNIYTIASDDSSWSFDGDGGPATLAHFGWAAGLAVDGGGHLYVVDNGNNRIRMIVPDGTIYTVAGDGNVANANDGSLATATSVAWPISMAVTATGALYIHTGTGGGTVRKVD